jgi:hypothetical protein
MNRVEGQGGPYNQEPTPSEAKRPENNQPTLEVGEGRGGVPPPLREPAKSQQESQEHQSVPDVWDVLERRIRVQERHSRLGESPGRRALNRLYRDDLEVRRLEEALDEKGTPRDKHILDLFYRTQPVLSPSRERFQEFRARTEVLSDEEIAEELRTRLEAIRANQHPGFSPRVGLLEFLKRKDKKP